MPCGKMPAALQDTEKFRPKTGNRSARRCSPKFKDYMQKKAQSDRWHFAEKRRYREILKQADTAEFLFERYTPDCMLRRDDAMVARSGYCVCYLRDPAAKRGGTAYTVRRAKKVGLEIIHLIPVEVEQLTLL